MTSISVVSAPTPIRVVKKNQTYGFGANDSLISASTNSVALTGTTTFVSGAIGGNPDFVLIEPPNTAMDRYFVEMSWSCESSGGTATSPPLGYQFELDTIGLTVPQKIVFRPRFNVTPKRIEWELYGDPRARFTIPVQSTPAGHTFDLTWGRFEMSGIVLSTSSVSATVRLDSLKFDGDDYGTLATYTFGVE